MIKSSNFNNRNVMFKACCSGVLKISIRYSIKENRQSNLYVVVPSVESYGVQKNNFENWPVDSYTLLFVMDDEATNEVLEQILQKCKAHLNKPEV